MGDRCNVYITEAEVFLYGHWCGYELAQIVRDALKRGHDRWSDSNYLARIVLCEMVKGHEMSTIGYGCSHTITDNGRPVIVLDPQKMEARVTTWSYHDSDCDITKTRDPIPFTKIVEMSDDEVRLWHLGKEEE